MVWLSSGRFDDSRGAYANLVIGQKSLANDLSDQILAGI